MNNKKESEYIAEIVRLKAIINRENGIKKINEILAEISDKHPSADFLFNGTRQVVCMPLETGVEETHVIPPHLFARVTTTASNTIILE